MKRCFWRLVTLGLLVGGAGEAWAQSHDWTRPGADAGMTKYSPDTIGAQALSLLYKKRFYTNWVSDYTGNYFYGNNLVIKKGQAILFCDDTDWANRYRANGGPLRATKFDWLTGTTRAQFNQPWVVPPQNCLELDSHHFTNPLILHDNGLIYCR